MAEFRRLISYIYEYEGKVKGKNVGFAKLETRNGLCKLNVSVKKLYMGSGSLGVYLLSARKEIFLGNMFLRNGGGEFRTVVQASDIEQSGETMDDCYGLTIHEKKDSWKIYTTIWEDSAAQAAELAAIPAAEKPSVSTEGKSTVSVEAKPSAPVQEAENPTALIQEMAGPAASEGEVHLNEETEPALADKAEEPSENKTNTGSVNREDAANEMEAASVNAAESAPPENEPGAVPETRPDAAPETERKRTVTAETKRIPMAGMESTPRTKGKPMALTGIRTDSAQETQETQEITRTPQAEENNRGNDVNVLDNALGGDAGEEEKNRKNHGQEEKNTAKEKIKTMPEKRGGYSRSRMNNGMHSSMNNNAVPPRRTQGQMFFNLRQPQPTAPESYSQRFGPAVHTPAQSANQGMVQEQRWKESSGQNWFGQNPSQQNQFGQNPSQQNQFGQNQFGQNPQFQNQQPFIQQNEEEPLIIGDPEALAKLEEEETTAQVPLWDFLSKTYPKIQAFESQYGCEILVIKPQDIGLLPREIWIYGNNSFLLHGYYNYRYLILARLENPNGAPRHLLGVPGHYFSNEKYMASMFGFPNFVLSKKQQAQDGRFGYWYTDIRIGDGNVASAAVRRSQTTTF